MPPRPETRALDERFHRADVDDAITEIDPAALTPFAVVVPFAPTVALSLEGRSTQTALLAALGRALPDGTPACALRVDDDLRARAPVIPWRRSSSDATG